MKTASQIAVGKDNKAIPLNVFLRGLGVCFALVAVTAVAGDSSKVSFQFVSPKNEPFDTDDGIFRHILMACFRICRPKVVPRPPRRSTARLSPPIPRCSHCLPRGHGPYPLLQQLCPQRPEQDLLHGSSRSECRRGVVFVPLRPVCRRRLGHKLVRLLCLRSITEYVE